MEGAKDRPKNERHPKISRQTEYRIKTILKESNQQQGWTTKQIEKMIIKESGIKYHHNYIYCILCRWGFKQKIPRKVPVNTSASAEEKEDFKKRSVRYLWVRYQKKDFNVVFMDESFIFYDSLVRRVVWIEDGKRPVVRVTGSYKHSCLFGAMSMECRKQLFRQYDN